MANKDRHFANRELNVLNGGKFYLHDLLLAWFPCHLQPKYFSAIIAACK
jgi:hypothetical protein